MFPRQTGIDVFDTFWDRALHDGVFEAGTPHRGGQTSTFRPSARFIEAWTSAADAIAGARRRATAARAADTFDVRLYETVGLRDGRHANNPWLQELPDPLTKVTWGNQVVLAPGDARDLHIVRRRGAVAADATPSSSRHIQPGRSSTRYRRARLLARARRQGGRRVGVNACDHCAGVRHYVREGSSSSERGGRNRWPPRRSTTRWKAVRSSG
jgi:hypothetical protein